MSDNVFPIKPKNVQNESSQDMVPFSFEGKPVRIKMINGEPWFVLADVAEILGYRMASDAGRILDDDEKDTHPMRTPGGMQNVTIISEPGLYRLVMRSDKPEAKRFQKWVVSEVLPAIRRTGSYIPAELTRKQILLMALEAEERADREHAARVEAEQLTVVERAKNAEANSQIEKLYPKALAFDGIRSAQGAFCTTYAAKMLKPKDGSASFGPRKLFAELRERGWMYKRSTTPTEAAQKKGLMFKAPYEYQPGKYRDQTYMTWDGLMEIAKMLNCEIVHDGNLGNPNEDEII